MTPIDPTDERALYDTWIEAFERTNAEFFDGTRGKDEPRGDTAGMLAVARAVLPEGYVAVPIELVRDALRFADHRSSEKCVHQHMNTLRSLIAESEATS